MDLRPGGEVELRFRHADLSPDVAPTPERFASYEGGVTVRGTITRCRPPHLLAFAWDEETTERSEVTFELM